MFTPIWRTAVSATATNVNWLRIWKGDSNSVRGVAIDNVISQNVENLMIKVWTKNKVKSSFDSHDSCIPDYHVKLLCVFVYIRGRSRLR